MNKFDTNFNDVFKEEIAKKALSDKLHKKHATDVEALTTEGYTDVELKDSGMCGLRPIDTRHGLYAGLSERFWNICYVYDTELDARVAFHNWCGKGEPLNYVVRKGVGDDYFPLQG